MFQRTRPRDLYDIWFMFEDGILVPDITQKKFKFKGLDLKTRDLLDRKDRFENGWNNSLRHQMKNVPQFNIVFENVMEHLSDIQWA